VPKVFSTPASSGNPHLRPIAELRELSASKMRAASVAQPAIHVFLDALERVYRGENGLMPEADLDPVGELPVVEELPVPGQGGSRLLNQLVVLKLNGGLGTGMGLERAKSLIEVKEGLTFLDFTARHILHFRKTAEAPHLAFMLMNSFNTREDTLKHLARYPELAGEGPMDFLQSQAPKLDATTLEPVRWPANPELEWCPPGHGDLYPSIAGSGVLARLLARGIRYLFVSNSDNLGASVDLRILNHLSETNAPFLMEVALRTPTDRKGGHLARRRADGALVLRESAQCPKADEAAFQDVDRHRYFNTNNLWIRLDLLDEELKRRGGMLPLPLIRNVKTVDPRDSSSTKVLQLETAMGAAIECFSGARAIISPRSRFAPVKTTSDLLALRSDAYRVTTDFRIELASERAGVPPDIELDPAVYKFLEGLDAGFPHGPISLLRCDRLRVVGSHVFEPGVEVVGSHEWRHGGGGAVRVESGRYGSSG